VSEAAAVGATEMEPEFLSVAQVARRLGCSVSLVQKWRRLGWLPATRLGPPDVPVYGYRPADVERFVSERWNRQRGRPSLGQLSQGGPAGSAPGEAGAPPPGAEGTERFKPPRLEPVGEEGPAIAAPAPAIAAPVPQAQSEAPAAVVAPPDTAPAQAVQEAAPAPEPAPEPPAPPPPPPIKTTGRPLVLWDGDPREGTAMVIARFPPTEAWPALNLATAWARRYNEVFLCEVPRPGGPPGVLAVWRRGERQPLP
jgi:transposase-like protein